MSEKLSFRGFIYAARLMNKNINNIEILHPYIPSPFSKETLKEQEHEIDSSKYYIEPIIFNKHLS